MSQGIVKFIKFIVHNQKGEIAILSTLFFLATAAFWILKPIKKGIFISHFKTNAIELAGIQLSGSEAEQLAKLTVVLTALLTAYLFSVAVRYFHPRKVFTFTGLLGAIGCLFFSSGLEGDNSVIIWFFYLFSDLQNSLLIVMLWSILHSAFRLKETKCVFTVISLSGLVGGLSGTLLVQQTLPYFGQSTMILACAGIFGLIAFIGTHYLSNNTSVEKPSQATEPDEGKEFSNLDPKPGSQLKYWIAIGLIVALYEMISGIIDFQLSLAVESLNSSELEKGVYFGYVGTIQNFAALLIQLFLTGFVMQKWGLKTALLVLPLTILFGSVGLLVIPSLAGAVFLAVSENGLNYSLNQQAKETLYVPAQAAERLRAKAFIDLFVQRFAKAAAVGLNLVVVAGHGLNATRWLAVIVVSLSVLWILVVNFTGKEFERLVLTNSTQ